MRDLLSTVPEAGYSFQSCGTSIDLVTPKTQVFSTAPCATTSRVAITRNYSISKHFTAEEARCAVVAAGESIVFDNVLAATTCVLRVLVAGLSGQASAPGRIASRPT